MGWFIGGAVSLLAFSFFGMETAFWIAFLTFTAHRAPAFAPPFFLLGLSFDTVRPVLGLQIGASEMALLALVSILLLGPVRKPGALIPHIRELSWKPLLLAVPFGLAVLLSGLANLETYKVLPHVARQLELMVTCWWAFNLLQPGRSSLPLIGLVLVLPAFLGGMGLFDLARLNSVAFGNHSNPNQYAAFVAMLVPFLLLQYLRASPGRRSQLESGPGKGDGWPWAISLWFGAFCLWASFSRSGLVSGMVAVAVVSALHVWRNKTFSPPVLKCLAGSVVFLVLGTLGTRMLEYPAAAIKTSAESVGALSDLSSHQSPSASPPLPGPETELRHYLSGRLTKRRITGAVRNRLVLQEFAAQLWLTQPLLGIGPGAYPEAFRAHRQEIKVAMFKNLYSGEKLQEALETPEVYGTLAGAEVHTHNLYSFLLVELGLLGLLGFLFYVGGILRILWSKYPASAWPIAGLALILALLVQSLVEVSLYSLSMELGVLIGLSLAPAESRTPGPQEICLFH